MSEISPQCDSPREHFGFRVVDKQTARPNDLFLLPDWVMAEESIPIETPPGVLRDPNGDIQLFAIPDLADDAPLMHALCLYFRGEERRVLVPEGAEVAESFGADNIRFIVEGNSGARGAIIRFLEVPSDVMLVLKCGNLNCDKLMAVPLSFWEENKVDLNLDTAIYPPDDSRSGFFCWDCWVPIHLRFDGLEPVDITHEEDFEAACDEMDTWQQDVEEARARRPPQDEWFA